MVYAILQLVGSQREYVSAWRTQREDFQENYRKKISDFKQKLQYLLISFYFKPHFLKANLG